MNKVKVLILLLCATVAAVAQLPYTVVTGTTSPTPDAGQVTISWPAHDVRGTSVHLDASSMVISAVGGVVNVSLVPTDRWMNYGGAEAKYSVAFTSGGAPVLQYWVVPTSSSPVSLTSVTISTGGSSSSTSSSSAATFGAALKTDLAQSATKVVRVAIFGDSLSRCTNLNCSVNAAFPTSTWVDMLRSYWAGLYPSHGTGIIPIRSQVEPSGSSEFDPTYFASASGTFDACNVGFQQLTPGIAGFMCYQMGTAVTTLTSKSLTFDKLGVYYLSNFSLTGLGFTVSIDGSSQGTFGTDNTGCCVGHNVYVPAPGGVGSHTFAIANVNTAFSFLYYVDGSIGNVGVSVDNLAMGAAKSEFFSKNNNEGAIGPVNTTQLLFTKYSVDDTWFIIMLTTNDYLNVPSSQTDNYLNGLMSDLITTHSVNPSKILLVVPPSDSPANAGQSGTNDQAWFNAKIQQIASTWGTAYLNVGSTDKRFLSFQPQSDASWMLTDNTHLNFAGQTAFFTAFKTSLGL